METLLIFSFGFGWLATMHIIACNGTLAGFQIVSHNIDSWNLTKRVKYLYERIENISIIHKDNINPCLFDFEYKNGIIECSKLLVYGHYIVRSLSWFIIWVGSFVHNEQSKCYILENTMLRLTFTSSLCFIIKMIIIKMIKFLNFTVDCL